ncbi:hypothetical protein F4860DRAFT_376775 [Xylaria cubensis]|nr:hypothetical protein F4860DRAFT_376775 [Xylaria cubensis]
MSALPCVQVRDLPPAASFYSAVSQPLGLRFVSAGQKSIVFGNPNPTFEVKAGGVTNRPTRIVLSASSPSVVSAFHAAARRANPKGSSHITLKDDDVSSGESRASATDLEGNVMEIVYVPTTAQSTAKQVTRILGWNLDTAASAVGAARSTVGSVAPSAAPSAAPSRPGLATLLSGDGDEAYRIIRRSFTSSTVETAPPQQKESKGLSTGAMVGTVLGAVAAGAAIGAGLSYAFSKRERDRAPRQEFEAPPFQRRATYPEPPYPDHQQPRYVEMERTVEKVRYPEQYPPGSNRYSHPAYTTRQPQASPPAEEVVNDRPSPSRDSPSSRPRDRSVEAPRKPLMITETEHRSNVGTRDPSPPRIAEVEHRSQVGSTKNTVNPKSQLHEELFKRRSPSPPRNTEPENRSQSGSTKTTVNPKFQLHEELFRRRSPVKADPSIAPAPRKAPSVAPDARSHVSSRSRHHDDDDDGKHRHRHRHRHHSSSSSKHGTMRHPDADTYVSAKTTNTVRPHHKSSSRSKGTSRAPSYVSASQEVQSPPERDWVDLGDDDDKDSVAPSDSISCIGEERPKPHARDLPFLQTRERIMIQ